MKKDSVKIVTIGGGSSYTPELIEGFIKRYDTLPVRELWLVDIEAGRDKLETVGALAKRMVEKAGVPMKIVLSYDRREALKDADFVTTQMRIGRLPARILDERIPLSHGMIGQETNGAGGMFKAFRTIPVILDIVKDIQELCPNAWLINFTNPAGMVTEAILRHTNFKKTIGLCNVPVNMVAGFAKMLGVEEKDVTMEIQGVNHFIFATDVFVNGESRFQELLDKYAHLSAEDTIQMKNFVSLPYSPAFIEGLGAIPCPYHNYYFFTKEQLEEELEQFKTGTVRGEVVSETEKELFELYSHEELAEKPKQLEMRGGAKYSDAACNLIQRYPVCQCQKQWYDSRPPGRFCCRGGMPDHSRRPEAARYRRIKASDQRLCTHDQSIRAYDNRSGRKRRQKSCCCRPELKSTLPER